MDNLTEYLYLQVEHVPPETAFRAVLAVLYMLALRHGLRVDLGSLNDQVCQVLPFDPTT
mgnify:FL=1